MTETPKRTRNTNSPLGPGEAFDRIADLRDSREARRKAIVETFYAEEAAKELAIAERVPAASQDRLAIMLRAYPDAQQMAGEAVANRHEPEPDAFPDELPAGARPLDPSRAERIGRLTGGGRK